MFSVSPAERRGGALGCLVAVALLAAACGSSSAASSSEISPQTTAPQQQGEDTVAWEAGSSVTGTAESTPGTSGTAANAASGGDSPDASRGDGGGTSADNGQQASGTTSTTVPAGPPAPLTGVPVTDESVLQRRAVAVKIDNNGARSRPHFGLAEADIVYEVLIEGATTRFVAVHHSVMPERTGPVRSARSGDIDLLADLDAPYFVYSGANGDVLSIMRRARSAGTITDLGAWRMAGPYWRDPARRSPHNFFFEYPRLEDPTSASVAPLFEYGPSSGNGAGLAGAAGVTVTYHASSGNVVSHVWDDVAQGWVRVQRGELHTTFSLDAAADVIIGREVAPANVVVLMCDYERSSADAVSPHLVSHGTGQAVILTAGSVYTGTWERSTDRAGFRFADDAGNPLKLTPGSTWLLMANQSRRFPAAKVETVSTADGAALLAEARQAAQAAASDSNSDSDS